MKTQLLDRERGDTPAAFVATTPFVSETQVRFRDVDGAGIVFYPRYFEMLNGAVEDWFAEHIGISFAELHLTRRLSVPTVSLATTFAAPSSLGDALTVALTVERLGTSSCTLAFTIRSGAEARVSGRFTIVCMELDRRVSHPWPDDLRLRMMADVA